MKKFINVKKLLRISGLIIILLLVTFVMYSLRTTAEKADYTSFSVGDSGIKALYLLTGEMGFKTGRFQKSARFLPQNSTLVIVYPDEEAINDEVEVKYLKEWVKAGNALIIASDRDTFINYEIASKLEHTSFGVESNDNLIAGQLGKGWVLLFDGGEELVNEHIDEVNYAVSFLKILTQAGYKQVYFNEYYHGLKDSGPLLFDIIGPTGRLILLQLMIALAAFVVILWRRFGKPVEVFEIIKRKENENLIAISNLYIKSRAEDIVLETYLGSFRAELSRYMGMEADSDDSQISAAAALDRLLKNRNIGLLLNECNKFINTVNSDKRRSSYAKRMLHLVERIENIRREIK